MATYDLCFLHRNITAVKFAFAVKFHHAISQGKQSMVTTHANIIARMKFSATLTHDDVTCDHFLTTKFFNTQKFWV